MKNYKIILTFLLSILFSKDKIAFISDVEGYVEIISLESNSILELEALEGRYIYEGDILRSYGDSYCTVIFEDQTALFSIAHESDVLFSNLEDGIKKIKLNYGELYVQNKSKTEPFFTFTSSTQIRCLSSSAFIKTSIKGDDAIYSIADKIDIYNKKSNISLNIDIGSKAFSGKMGEIKLENKEDSFLYRTFSNRRQ